MAARHTGARLGRLNHHVHILEMKGDSYRPWGSRHTVEPFPVLKQAQA